MSIQRGVIYKSGLDSFIKSANEKVYMVCVDEVIRGFISSYLILSAFDHDHRAISLRILSGHCEVDDKRQTKKNRQKAREQMIFCKTRLINAGIKISDGLIATNRPMNGQLNLGVLKT